MTREIFCYRDFRDKNGYYQITGRVDDVINVTGHRLGTAEVEDVMVNAITTTTKFVTIQKGLIEESLELAKMTCGSICRVS